MSLSEFDSFFTEEVPEVTSFYANQKLQWAGSVVARAALMGDSLDIQTALSYIDRVDKYFERPLTLGTGLPSSNLFRTLEAVDGLISYGGFFDKDDEDGGPNFRMGLMGAIAAFEIAHAITARDDPDTEMYRTILGLDPARRRLAKHLAHRVVEPTGSKKVYKTTVKYIKSQARDLVCPMNISRIVPPV